jgi:predicted peptidase
MIGTIAKDAPPLFILTASNDGLNLAPHSVDLYSAWLGAKKDVELHMYARGNHGFGMRTQNLPTDKWIERFDEWLGVQGLLKAPDPALVPYQRKEFVMGENVLPYRILYPDNYDKTKKYPLVMFLHGSGERATDNEIQLVHGSKLFLNESNRKAFPAIVIFPQCPQDASWIKLDVDRTVQPAKLTVDYTSEAQWPLTAANELVKRIASEEAVDKSRIYISGLSLGGFGTFESVYRYPDLYAAALPICGGGDVNSYDKRVARTAFWIFHGDADPAVDVKLSREMSSKLKSLKVESKYTEYPGVKHDSWNNAFAETEYLKWMFAHKRK